MSSRAPKAMQRTASLVPLPQLLSEFGVSIDAVLDGTGVSVEMLGPDRFIAYARFLDILDNSARLTGRDDFGLLLGFRQTLDALGPLGQVMRHSATLGEALSEFATFQISNSTGGTVYLIRAERDLLWCYGVYDPEAHASPHIHDMVLAVGRNFVDELTHGAVKAREILSSRDRPKDLGSYRSLGECPIRFNESVTALVLTAADLSFRLPEADNQKHAAALAELAPDLARARSLTRVRVRHLLRHLLLIGSASMTNMAAHLGMHPRALRRRLHAEGTTFEATKDEVRYATARELLKLNALDIADIAATLDYASVSSFSHAFQRWSGTSPRRWRQRA